MTVLFSLALCGSNALGPQTQEFEVCCVLSCATEPGGSQGMSGTMCTLLSWESQSLLINAAADPLSTLPVCSVSPIIGCTPGITRRQVPAREKGGLGALLGL